MIGSNVARRYAKALLALGLEEGNLNLLVDEVSAFSDLYSSSEELRGALANPLVAFDAKRAILADLGTRLAVSATTRSTLGFLLERRRIGVLPQIAAQLRELNDTRRGVLRAEVWTAVTLSEEYYERLRVELERMTGQRVTLERNEDPTILGGVITRVGDMIVDGSLRSRLQEMKQSLLAATAPA